MWSGNEVRSKEAELTSVSSQHKVDIGAKPDVKFLVAHEVSEHHLLNHTNFCFLLLMCVCVKEGGRRGREGRSDRHLQNYKLDPQSVLTTSSELRMAIISPCVHSCEASTS